MRGGDVERFADKFVVFWGGFSSWKYYHSVLHGRTAVFSVFSLIPKTCPCGSRQVGPLVEKLFELDGARLKSPPPQDPRTPHGLGGNCKEGNSGFDAEHKAEPTPAAASPDETVDEKTGTAKEEAARLDSLGYGDPRGPLWVRRQIAGLMEKRMFHREVDPERLCIAAGAKTVLR